MNTSAGADTAWVHNMLGGLPTDHIGPFEQWPADLKTTFRTMVASPHQVVLFWGEEYLALYNEAYAPTIGVKHPEAFGRPARDYWSELWDDLKPLLDQVMIGGNPVFLKDRPFYIERHGHPETVTFDIAYSAVPMSDGAVGGVLCIVSETTERTKGEQRLRESEARFRNMADHAPVMMWVVDEIGSCTYLNTKWYEFTGQSQEEAEGFGWLDATHPDDKEVATRTFLEALARREGFRLEYRLRRHDGAYRWAIDAAEPRFSPEGTFLGYIGSVIDIDERHDMEQKLWESESGLRALTNSIDQMVWATRPDGFHDFYNDRWYEFTGVEPGSTDGAGWNEIFHPDDRDRAWAVWQDCLHTGKPYHIEYRLRHSSGQYRWVIGRANPIHNSVGQITRWYGTCTDVHELKIAEIQRTAIMNFDEQVAGLRDPGDIVQAAVQTIGSLMKVSRAGYGTIDEALETVSIEHDWTTGGMSSLSGLRRFRDYGMFIDDLKNGKIVVIPDAEHDPRTRDRAVALEAISARASVNVPLREQSGLVAVLFVNNSTPTDWRDEDVTFLKEMSARLRNAVERRRAENELLQLTESLEEKVTQRTEELRASEERLRHSQKLETIGKLTGGVAHDFNNLLQVVSGNLHLLQKDLVGDEKAQRRLTNAMSGVNRGAKLASQLLAFGRRQALDPKIINVGRFLRDMDDMLRRSIGEAVEIEMVIAGGLWNCLADPAQVENAVLNLAINARDAMDGQGKLTVEVGNAFLDDNYAAKHVEVEAGQYVMISVTDTGCGIPADMIDQVFEPFFSTKSEGKGTGLGLSMVFGFVKQSGGHVKIYSEVGHGTTVRIYLPRALASEDRETPIALGPIVGGSETILVAEDDDEVRTTVVETLSDLGYSVLKASSAEAALVIIESGIAIDVLFTDVVMPGSMKSTELAKRAKERQPDLAVLYTSGYTENSIVHGGRLDAGVELLSKPYTREALARKIRHVLGNRAQRTQVRSQKTAVVNVPEHTVPTLNVLLVEDDALIRMNTAEMLIDLGHTVLEAGSGKEALMVAQSSFDLLVTDIGLPDVSGYDLVRELQSVGRVFKVILASGQSRVTDEAFSGATLITKPYSQEDLANAIKEILGR
ncbi:PAS domain S-box protein [Agrobacterium sp. AGB01]|uniref:PAS domain S-box protein n=1 Tax=Agrobacterium sp. AGB01 TaxID=2769302 RepID=UPI00177E7D40|nr:PAS domain S-box protein [Agrobacterium sp. AGB01]MBD9388465.1 PAS domain S-box protein [Agrobacterium sp. AGB01]